MPKHLPKEAAEELLKRRRARSHLKDFAHYMQYEGNTPALHHDFVLDNVNEVMEGVRDRLMLFMPPGMAKALAIETPIPTPYGWRCLGELEIGDEVFDEEGRPCRVTWKSPFYVDRPCYRVVTDCGDEIVADQDHEWVVRLCGKRPLFSIKETWELCRTRSKRPMIQRARPLLFPDSELPVDPYLLGIWLGDGNSQGLRITSSKEDIGWLRKEIERLGYTTTDQSVATNFGITGIRSKFTDLGLLNGNKKFIPDAYMRSNERLNLLQGLIDSGGSVEANGQLRFCNTNKALALQVRELVRSLGVKAGWSESRAMLNGKDCGPVYRISFYLQGAARMPRKAERTRNQSRTPNTYIDVIPTDNATTVCIEVDSPNSLYLCGQSMTPTHNSTYCSIDVPAYFMGKWPDKRIISASYDSSLVEGFGGKVRNMIAYNERFNALFPGLSLSQDTKAKGHWNIKDHYGGYYATGVNSAVTGRRANLAVLDDLVKGQKEADSPTIMEHTWRWLKTDLGTRLLPDAAVIIIMCMTGDTPVLMANGQEKPLSEVRKGDQVATYENGQITTSTVLNWRNNGSDSIFRIKMKSGIMVRANERHPFLVDRSGDTEWVRLKNLKVGERILRVTGENGEGLSVASPAVTSQRSVRGAASSTITDIDGLRGYGRPLIMQNRAVTRAYVIATALAAKITTECLRLKTAFVQFVRNPPPTMCAPIGETSSASITATTATKSGAFSATTAILPLVTGKHPKYCAPPQTTYKVTADEIAEISACGIEDVFDIQVERTENFIANGLVSHNTRWSQNDPPGRLLPEDWNGESGDIECSDGRIWRVVCIPAEAGENDPLGRSPGEFLWTDYYTDDWWELTKKDAQTSDIRFWGSLYQQTPAPEEGVEFKREWFKWYTEPPKHYTPYMAMDCAVTKDRGDFTEIGVFGVDRNDDLYIAPDFGWYSGKVTPDVWIDAILDLAENFHPQVLLSEKGVIRNATEGPLDKRMAERKVYVSTEWLPHIGDKSANARAFQARCAQGKVYLPKNDIGRRILKQLLEFPAGKHDDIVDVCGLMGRHLQDTVVPNIQRVEKKTMDRWDKAFQRKDNVAGSWKTA